MNDSQEKVSELAEDLRMSLYTLDEFQLNSSDEKAVEQVRNDVTRRRKALANTALLNEDQKAKLVRLVEESVGASRALANAYEGTEDNVIERADETYVGAREAIDAYVKSVFAAEAPSR